MNRRESHLRGRSLVPSWDGLPLASLRPSYAELAERVMLMDLTIGRKGLVGYLKALGGSNIVKVTPSTVDASGVQVNGHKRLRVICGANTSYLADNEWISDKTPLTVVSQGK